MDTNSISPPSSGEDKIPNDHEIEEIPNKSKKSTGNTKPTARNSTENKNDSKSKHSKQEISLSKRENHKMDIDKKKTEGKRPTDSNNCVKAESKSSQDQITTNCDNSLSPSIETSRPIIDEKTATIPDTILSPPKSETQTDETNTASPSSSSTSNSASPSSDTQMSPTQTDELKSPKVKEEHEKKLINVIANGTIPKSGKPLVSAMNKKLNKTTRAPRVRKQKSMVTTLYESEISDHKVGIKLCIKKSDTSFESPKTTASASKIILSSRTSAATANSTASKPVRKRSRKSKSRPQLDSDESEYEPKRKNAEKQKKQISFSSDVIDKDEQKRPQVEQSDWGAKMPEEVLFNIFQLVVNRDGCLPTLFRLGRVCTLWRRVSLFPTLWKSLDLSTWIKEKHRTELKLKWFLDNLCTQCTELNVANWKVSDINCFLQKLANGCPNLTSITLSGWKTFNCDHLTFLVDNLPKLERLDLSSVNVEMNASKSAVGVQSLCNALQTMNGRLTHLYLAHNRLAGIPQIVNVLAKHCPNVVLLDLSNVTTQATSHGILHIEKLQHGCQKLKVLRVTNSHVTLSNGTLQNLQMDSPGFPDLEELSVATLTHESRIICDEHLQRILKTSSKLKLLDVRGCMRLTHESLIRLPAWDIKHLFLSGCSITRDVGSGLELIASKWAHSLIELDLAWANVQQSLDNALRALAEKGAESPLAHLNLCGSSVSEEAVKEILANCPNMSSINLASCRGLPRGVKRLMQGSELQELRDVLKVQLKVKITNESILNANARENSSNEATSDIEKSNN